MNLGPEAKSVLTEPLDFNGNEEDFIETLIGLTKIFEASIVLPKNPVIVIDEANEIMEWLKLNLVHVILATTDYFLVGWLPTKGLSEFKFSINVFGELPENEARDFLFGDAQGTWPGLVNNPDNESLPAPPCSEEQWREIYEHCGGNIWLLRQCVTDARGKENWDGALKDAVSGAVYAVIDAAKPHVLLVRDTPPLWNGAQWKRVLELITNAPYHAVPQCKIERELEKDSGGVSGHLILFSMVKYNLLTIRYPSNLARDLTQEVYGGVRRTVVTFTILCLGGEKIAPKQELS